MSRRHYLLAAALIGAASAASAQTTPAQTTPAQPAPATPAPAIVAPAPAPLASTTPAPTSVGQLQTSQYLGSKLDGANVYNPADEKIADVADVVFSDQGQVVAVILGYGGVAGIGRSYVAVKPSDLKVRREGDSSDLRVQTSMTLDDLKRAPQFSYTERRRN